MRPFAGGVDSGEAVPGVGQAGSTGETSSSQFCCEFKMVLKK